jgi:hypothetical protein
LDDAASIKDWLGRTQRDEDEIALGAVQRLAATLASTSRWRRRHHERRTVSNAP